MKSALADSSKADRRAEIFQAAVKLSAPIKQEIVPTQRSPHRRHRRFATLEHFDQTFLGHCQSAMQPFQPSAQPPIGLPLAVRRARTEPLRRLPRTQFFGRRNLVFIFLQRPGMLGGKELGKQRNGDRVFLPATDKPCYSRLILAVGTVTFIGAVTF